MNISQRQQAFNRNNVAQINAESDADVRGMNIRPAEAINRSSVTQINADDDADIRGLF